MYGGGFLNKIKGGIKIELSKKTMKITIAVLLASLVIMSAVAYTFWLQREVSFYAKISTVIDFNLYEDEACTIPFTTYDWGDFGAGSKEKTIYLLSEANDVIYIEWNLTTLEWTWVPTSGSGYYTNTKFNFTIYRGAYDPDNPFANVWTPNYGYEEAIGNKVPIILRAWTTLYEATPSQSWSIVFYGYDTK